jgi:hypothetical protein
MPLIESLGLLRAGGASRYSAPQPGARGQQRGGGRERTTGKHCGKELLPPGVGRR